MPTEKVYVIYYPYLSDKLYYVCNTEWDFEVKKARFFKSELMAQIALTRLQGTDKNQIENQGVYVKALKLEAQELETTEYLHFQVP